MQAVRLVDGDAVDADAARGDDVGRERTAEAEELRDGCVDALTGEPVGQEHVIIGGNFVGSLTRHVMESFAYNAGIALHVRVLSGRDPHHIVEAQFKAVARALRDAVAHDPRVTGVPSTKGSL